MPVDTVQFALTMDRGSHPEVAQWVTGFAAVTDDLNSASEFKHLIEIELTPTSYPLSLPHHEISKGNFRKRDGLVTGQSVDLVTTSLPSVPDPLCWRHSALLQVVLVSHLMFRKDPLYEEMPWSQCSVLAVPSSRSAAET